MRTVLTISFPSTALFPGSQIAKANGARTRLLIESGSAQFTDCYPQSGTPAPFGAFALSPLTGWLEFTAAEDPELVKMEWWAYSIGSAPGGVVVIEEVEL